MENKLPLPRGVTIALNKVMPRGNGAPGDPAIGFESDPTIGWYMNDSGEVVFTSGLDDTMLQNPNYTEFRKPIMLNEFEPPRVDLRNKGILYKKPDDPGLWWLTEDGEINVAAGAAPPAMRMSMGTSYQPSYTFGSDCNSGFFLDSPGNIGVTAKGVEVLRVNKENLKVFRPMEIMDTSVLETPATPLTGYLYKKAGEQGLWWRTAKGDIDLTADLPASIKQPKGQPGQPSYSFIDDSKAGLYLIEPGRIALAVNSSPKLEVKNSEVVSDVSLRVPDGSVGMPSLTFAKDVKTGIYTNQYGHMSIAASGTKVLDISQENIAASTPVKAPELQLVADSTTKISGVKGRLDLVAGGNSKLEVSTAGVKVLDILSLEKGLEMQANSLRVQPDGALHVFAGAKSVMHTDVTGLHANEVLAKHYGFENSPTIGFSAEAGNININSGTGAIRLRSKVELEQPLQLPSGSLFTKLGQAGLYWQTPYGEIDLTSRGLAELPKKMEMPNGSAGSPVYSFAASPSSGLSMINGSVAMSVAGRAVQTFESAGVTINGKLNVKDSSGVVSLYKKSDSKDLFAKSSDDIEVNLTSPEQKFPIEVPSGKSVNFAGLQITANGSNIDIAKALKIQLDRVSLDGVVEIKEQFQPACAENDRGVLYKEKGSQNLIWQSGGTHHVLTKDITDFKAVANSDFKKPEFTFRNDLDTGLSKIEDNVVGLVAGGQLVLAAAQDQAMLYKPMSLTDSVSASPAVNTEGRLYKKANSSGLYWQTMNTEVDLTQQRYPLAAPNGVPAVPTYGFSSEPGYGMTKVSDAVVLAAGGRPSATFRTTDVTVHGKLKLSHDNQTGQLEIRQGKLFWNDVDLCNGMKYPIYAPDSSEASPAYSFASNSSLGLAKINDSLAIVGNNAVLAQFASSKASIPNLSTNKMSMGTSGALVARGTDLVWQPVGSKEIVIRAPADEFNGGVIGEDLDAPGVVLRDYRLSQDLQGRLDVSNSGQTVLKVSTSGLQTTAVNLPNTQLKETNGVFTVEGKSGVILKASEHKLEIQADTISIADGALYKSGDSLLWQTDLGPVDLTDKTVQFPLRAPMLTQNNETTYGYEGSNVGIAKDGNALVLKSENSYAVLEDDGYLTAIGINTMQLCAADGLTITTGSPGQITKITKDKLETSGVFRGKKDSITFGYDIADYTVGITPSGGGLALVSGKTQPTIFTDNSVNVRNRSLAFNDASLERKGSDLYWKVGSEEVHLNKPHETWYRETLSYIADGDIKKGDIVCMDPNGSGKIYKGIGGKIQKIPAIPAYSDSNKAMSVFDYNSANYVLAFTKTKLMSNRTQIIANVLLVSKDLHIVQKNYEFILTKDEYPANGILTDGYGKIIQINPDTYVIPYLKPDENHCKICKLKNPFSLTPTIETLDVEIGVVCNSMTAEYDHNNDCLVIVCHSNTTQNFAVVLISVGREDNTLELGTIETNLSSLAVADINKQIHLVLIPGGTCIVSYGIMKMVFIISSYQGSITPGDSFMDYESVDCAGMFYDTNNGVVMTLEKTVSGSCYLQILDVLGIAIQKLTSKGFNNANIEPLGIAYNSLVGSYAILYATGPADVPVYIQTFDFDGEIITFGLRYQDTTSTYEPTNSTKHEKNLFEIPGTKMFVYGYDPNVLSVFEAGYHGYPSGYLGIASDDAVANQQCNIVVKGHIYKGAMLPQSWLGKKLYITDPTKDYPECLSIQPQHGVFLGTCLDSTRVLLGL